MNASRDAEARRLLHHALARRVVLAAARRQPAPAARETKLELAEAPRAEDVAAGPEDAGPRSGERQGGGACR